MTLTTKDRIRVYVDANVFLNPVLYKADKVPEAAHAKDFLQKVITKEIDAFTSVLTWDEFVWVLWKENSSEFAKEKGQEFLLFPNLRFESITFDIVKKAQELLEVYSLKPRDAIHLATALRKNLSEMVTFDEDFKDIPMIRYHPP